MSRYEIQDRSLIHMPDIEFTTADATWVESCRLGTVVKVEGHRFGMPGYEVKGFVREIMQPVDALLKVTVRPTCAPYLVDAHAARAASENITRQNAKRRNFLSLYGGPALPYVPYYWTSPPWATSSKGFLAGAMQESIKHLKEKMAREVQKAANQIGEDILLNGSQLSYVTEKECRDYLLTIRPHTMCRCTPIGITTRETNVFDKEKIKANRFYVGSRSTLERNWGHAKLEGAVGHATKMIEEERLEEEYFIVKIIKVVRRKKQPVVVEDVK